MKKNIIVFFFFFLFSASAFSATKSESQALCESYSASKASSLYYPVGGSCVANDYSETNGNFTWLADANEWGTSSVTSWEYIKPLQCEGNDTNTTILSGSSGGVPSSVCYTGCTYNQSGPSISFSGSGSWEGKYNGTTASCSFDDAAVPDTPDNCISSSSGNLACYDVADQNCGSFNGEPFCVADVAANNCLTSSNGSAMCATGSPNAPDNGIAGTPAIPDDSFSLGGNNGSGTGIDYFSPGTVSSASNSADFDPNANPPADPPPTVCDPATDPNGCQSPAECGTSSTPPCAVLVDESGTPVGSDSMFQNDVGQSLIDNISTDAGFSSPTLIPALPSAGDCQTIAITWGNVSRNIPSSLMCSRIETFKGLLSWFFYILTAFFLFTLATRRPA